MSMGEFDELRGEMVDDGRPNSGTLQAWSLGEPVTAIDLWGALQVDARRSSGPQERWRPGPGRATQRRPRAALARLTCTRAAPATAAAHVSQPQAKASPGLASWGST